MNPVVDTNVLVRGKGLDFEKIFLTQDVLDEVESSEGKNRLRNIQYEVKLPSEDALKKIKEKSNKINSPTSETDERLLALAMTIDAPLVTDDKPLQNLALHLDVDFKGFMDEPADKKFKWVKLCEGCGIKTVSSSCPRCGSQTREKQVNYNSR